MTPPAPQTGPPSGPRTFYVVTYRPLPKKRCSSLGCVSPPPLPASLRGYGTRSGTTIVGDWIVDVLVPSEDAVRPGSYELRPLR